MKKSLLLILCALTAAAMVACSDDAQKEENKTADLKVQALLGSVLNTWEMKTSADVTGVTYPGGYQPSCSNCPGTDPTYAFFVKRGDPTKVLVFFMGGGACWDITNCVYSPTYTQSLYESVMMLSLLSAGQGKEQGVGGFLDMKNSDNPFKGWTIVYVPYCTGDLNAGQEDHEYTDTYNPDPASRMDPVTIRHRGASNRTLVLEWMKANIPAANVTKLFITGLSAGSYASLLAFPYFRQEFPNGDACYLGDAGVGFAGVTNTGSGDITFTQIAQEKWDVDLPDWVFEANDISDYDEYKDVVYAAVNYYRTNKPGDRFAQYTTKYDRTQAWFYNIQVGDHINYPNFWGSESGADPDLPVYEAWSTGMQDAILITLENYRYYIAAGTDHTIIFYNKTYTETSGGTSFIGWIDDLVNGTTMPDTTACSEPDCGAPF